VQNVSSGGTAYGTTVKNGGTQTAAAGGVLDGTQPIETGGVASGGTLIGVQNVAGTATDITVNSGGTQNVNNGGRAEDTTVNSGGRQNVNDGGTAEGTTINSGGTQIVSAGGTASGTILNIGSAHDTTLDCPGGVQIVSSGGTAVNTTVYGTTNNYVTGVDGTQIVSSGGVARGTKDAGGVLELHNGAVLKKADGTSMGYGDYALSGGILRVTDGVSVNYSTYALSNGTIEVTTGGTASIKSVGPQGIQIISGGSASGTVETLDGYQKIYSGGVGSATVMGGYAGNAAHQEIYSGGAGTIGTMNYGVQTVSNGGTGTVSTMNGGTQVVNSGGVGTVTALQSGGTQVVYSGGTSTNTHVMSGGVIEESGSGEKTITDPTFEAGGIHRLVNGATKDGLLVSGHILEIVNGGTVTSATVQSGGTANVVGGGIALNTTVSNGGTQNVSNGGDAQFTSIYSSGVQNVNNGGSTYATYINGGVQNVNSGGTANINYISVGGVQNVNNGGYAKANDISAGGVQNVNDGGTTDCDYVSGVQNVNSGGMASASRIYDGGTQIVSSGGTADSTHIESGGVQMAEAGGILAGTQGIDSGGVASGGTLTGEQFVHSGGSAAGVTVASGGIQKVENGGVASGGTVNSGGVQTISSGGIVTNAILNGGTQTVSAGGVASGGTLNSGTQTVQNGGKAENVTVNGGTQNIENGGTATSVTVNGGVQTVASGAVVSAATINGGTQILSSGASIDGDQTVAAGGVASGGTITSTHTQHVYGRAAGATINSSGTQHVYGGGYATATKIENGGTLIVEDKGTAQVAKIDSANACVELRDLGDATVIFGGSANETFTVPNLSATGDNVRLRAEGDFTVPVAAAGGHKELTVTKISGHADFYVNTDVANNAADIVHITSVTGASSANKIRINYDPTLAAGNAVASTHTMVAESGDGKATFEGAKSTVGGLSYLPTVTAEGNNWYITKVDSLGASEASHHTLMAMTAATAALAAGTAFIDDAARGLSLASNVGADGVSSFAKMGGGSVRQETGSYVDVHTWNAILALGHANKKERGTFEYGAFFEYGSGNYTTECEDTRRGDGSLRYTGGGVLAKWTDAHGLYVEGSFRAGTVHDDARDVLHDDMNTYSYETDAGYLGAHLGVGREIALADGNSVDVYGKYFMSRRNGVSFRTGGNAYDLDAVRSQVLRVGARYMMKREKWNFYGGLAYEHEFDGMANGTVDGHAIRGADIGGGSFRAELGATMTPGENSPWKLDLNLAGFAGKKQGVSGGVSVAFMF